MTTMSRHYILGIGRSQGQRHSHKDIEGKRVTHKHKMQGPHTHKNLPTYLGILALSGGETGGKPRYGKTLQDARRIGERHNERFRAKGLRPDSSARFRHADSQYVAEALPVITLGVKVAGKQLFTLIRAGKKLKVWADDAAEARRIANASGYGNKDSDKGTIGNIKSKVVNFRKKRIRDKFTR